ncbi:MAG: hypothetical protein H0U98_03610 [Alphaproteobacteria bacterium]|nr:hypothetical protein [Alphaproteobacteria bacterium]
MSRIAKAALAAALLNCGLLTASAQETANNGQWLKDGTCSLFSAGAAAGDTVNWTGSCVDGYAEGLGTATFTHDGQSQIFTANFQHGVIPDGHVITRWGAGWSYDGETVGGRFQGAGILTTDTADRFEGLWAGGKMNGFGLLRRANGERYAGDWKDDKPNGNGELFHADGTRLAGTFTDGKLMQAVADTKAKAPQKSAAAVDSSKVPFGGVAGKTLTGVDGSSIALNLIEGGMELQVVPAEGTARKTTFTFMTDRMGTVVEDSDAPSAGSSVTGFFRLTGKGVEIRYSDGRSAMLAANPDGGVQMALDGDAGPSCRAWYPTGHAFSDMEKKAALNAYASKLGLPVAASETSEGCAAAPKPQAANIVPPGAIPPALPSAPSSTKPKPERRAAAKAPARMAKASYRVGDYQASYPAKGALEQVSVKTSEIHTIDSGIAVPSTAIAMAAPTAAPSGDKNDAGRCLKVDSDGNHWGFRNSCDFAVQFAYCMAGGSDTLTACGAGNTVTTSAAGSVAAGGFGALMADMSLKDKDASHNFRWIACGGGAGEVIAHLDHFEPPAGRCERTRSASNQ